MTELTHKQWTIRHERGNPQFCRWTATHENYDGPPDIDEESPRPVYYVWGPSLDDVQEQIAEIDAELET